MRRLRDMSIEELLDQYEETRELIDEDKLDSLYRLIDIEEVLYRKIRSDKESEYAASLPLIKKRLISHLVRYGFYLKTIHRKDDRAAKDSLRKALTYEKHIPAAHYRLGFLAYKEERYLEATIHFNNAIIQHKKDPKHAFKLTPQQLYNANLYLCNSSLYIAQEAKEMSEEIKGVKTGGLGYLGMSPLYEMIAENEGDLEDNEFTIISQDGEETCSKDGALELAESALEEGKFVLYFSERTITVSFWKERNLGSIERADLLKFLLLESNENYPMTKSDYCRLISKEYEEVPNNTFVKTINRLKGKLEETGVPANIIQTKPRAGKTGYFYNQDIPYLIIQRTDEIQ